MDWLRIFNRDGNTLPNIVNVGPAGCAETTYSFDYGNAHFVVLNEYFDGSSDVGADGEVWFYTYRLNLDEKRWGLADFNQLRYAPNY